MKRAAIITLLCCAAFAVGALSITLTFGNAGWHIKRAFPGSNPHFDPVYSPDPTLSSMLRVVLPSYFSFDESLGVIIQDRKEEIDLERGFALIPHKRFFSVHVKRCKVVTLCRTNLPGYPSIVVFEDCDFSLLPESQRQQLRVYDPEKPEKKQLCIGSI